MAFNSCAQSLPFEIEIVDKKYTLRIADVEDGAIAALDRCVQLFDRGRAHIHFEGEAAPVACEQTQMLRAGSSADSHLVVRCNVRFHQQGCSAACTVAGNLTAAAIGI